jgi:hypothetical protein
MTKIIYTLIRYALTAAGASEAIATDDLVMQIVSGIVAVGSVAWGIFEAKQHVKLAASSGSSDTTTASTASNAVMLIAFAMLLPLTVAMSACSTTTSTASNGTTVTTTSVDWTVVDFTVQKSAKYATVAVLEKHSDYADELAAIGAGLTTIVSGAPAEADIKTALKSLAPKLDDESATAIASVLKDACDLYEAKSGKTTIVSTDENVQGLVKALAKGIDEGIALHNAK